MKGLPWTQILISAAIGAMCAPVVAWVVVGWWMSRR